ncbi:MAG: hypothetical protein ABII71_01085 [Candidatus Micrarchaeota archaeon]
MSIFDEKAKAVPAYDALIAKMYKEDLERMDFAVGLSNGIRLLQSALYSSMQWPVKFHEPMFEARAIYAVPQNYYQNIYLDGEKLGVAFAHGAMRSIFFVGGNLVALSKQVNHREGREFFTSYVLLHLGPGEFSHKVDGDKLWISADVKKPMLNLATGKPEMKSVKFNFVNQSVMNRIVSKEQVVQSDRFKQVYQRFGGARAKAASIDIEGYAVTVPHFSPHPYLLQLHKEFGFESNRQMQEHVIDYFNEHLGL